jgi:hypothetical protein
MPSRRKANRSILFGCFLCGSTPARKRTPYNKPYGTKGLLPTCEECHLGLPVQQDPETGEWVMTVDLRNH